jgi:hypothetical protein
MSPLILVHYVPASKVKLISLGALTRPRFTYSIGPDRAMTVLDPSGKHLCTWTCPLPLMAPCGVGKMHYQDLHSDSTSSSSAAIGNRVFSDLPAPPSVRVRVRVRVLSLETIKPNELIKFS